MIEIKKKKPLAKWPLLLILPFVFWLIGYAQDKAVIRAKERQRMINADLYQDRTVNTSIDHTWFAIDLDHTCHFGGINNFPYEYCYENTNSGPVGRIEAGQEFRADESKWTLYVQLPSDYPTHVATYHYAFLYDRSKGR